MTFIQARNFKRVGSRSIDVVVAHSMENDEKPGSALAVAKWFAGSTAPEASAHSCVDNVATVNCVRDHDVAYAAPGANHNGYQIEHAGRARQSRADWLDPFSLACLRNSAADAARVVKAHRIPIRFVNAAGLRRGLRGITTHYEVSQAFKKSTHWDPGQGFPMDIWLEMIGKPTQVLAPSPPGKEPAMAYRRIENPSGPGFWILNSVDGGVGAYEGAPFFGSVPGVDVDGISSPATDLCPFVAHGTVLGYWVTLANGSLYGFGAAPHLGAYDQHPDWHGGDREIFGIDQIAGFEGGDIAYRQLGREPKDPPYVFDAYAFPLKA